MMMMMNHLSSPSSVSPLVVAINRCHSAPDSTTTNHHNMTTAAPSLWRSRLRDGAVVDLKGSLQQLCVLDGVHDLASSDNSSSSDNGDAVLDLEEALVTTTNNSRSVPACSSRQQQPLHMSNAVVGDIEMCLMKQQYRDEDWESASF